MKQNPRTVTGIRSGLHGSLRRGVMTSALLTGFGLSIATQSASAGQRWAPQSFGAPAKALSSSPASGMGALSGDKAIAELKKRGQYQSLSEAIVRARYGVRAVEGDQSRVWAQNPNHNLSSRFDERGVSFTVRVPQKPGKKAAPTGVVSKGLVPDSTPYKSYQSAWRLQSVGYGKAQNTIPQGIVRREGQRVEVRRAPQGLVEWFNNAPGGLEHGFTLQERPAMRNNGAPLRLVMAVKGDLQPHTAADGQSLDLRDARQRSVLSYDHLKVWDAAGQSVPATMRASHGEVTLDVQDGAARYPLTIDPTFAQQAYLKASNPGAGDQFGQSVSVSGDTVVVGALGEDGGTPGVNGTPNESVTDSGAAYVFTRSGPTWSQQAYLKASNPGAYDGFGWSVTVLGDTIVVGAVYEDSSTPGVNSTPNEDGFNSGAAYVFTRSGITWTEQAYLKASNPGVSDYFGESVAISGDTIAVGVSYEDSSVSGVNSTPDEMGLDSGAAYVFVRSGATWSQQAYLKASNTDAGDKFGQSVAVSGDMVIVGAPGEDSSTSGVDSAPDEDGLNPGAAYVFTRSGTTWSQQNYLKASNPNPNDEFGSTVAVSGDTLVISASLEDSGTSGVNSTPDESAPDSGAVYAFARSGTTWTEQAYLKASNPGAGDNFGLRVAVSGDTIVVGAYAEDSGTGGVNSTPNESASSSGAAYVFARSGVTWSQQAYLKASSPGATDLFGQSVAVSGDTIVVGARLEDSSTSGINSTPNEAALDSGAAYVFYAAPPPTLTIDDITAGESDASAIFTVTLSQASAQDVTVQYATAAANSSYTAAPGADFTPVGPAMLTIPAGQTSAQITVSILNDTLDENDERFRVVLSSPTNATLGDSAAFAVITDDDALPSVSLSDVTQLEGNSGGTAFTFTATLSQASGRAVVLKYQTAKALTNPATAGSDYVPLAATVLSFAAGETSKTIAVQVNGDTLNEDDERFLLTLSNATNVLIGDGEGLGTITNDDALPSITVNDVTVGEDSPNAMLTITLSAASGKTVALKYITGVASGNSATAGADYTALPTTIVTFAPGQTSKQVMVPVLEDALDEYDERFALRLYNCVNATLSRTSGFVTITDNDAVPALSINDVVQSETNSGNTAFTFTISLSQVSGRGVSLKYLTAKASSNAAIAGTDYVAVPATVITIPAGQTSRQVTVQINGDTSVESDEKFLVKLTSPANATLGNGEGVGTITNDDASALAIAPLGATSTEVTALASASASSVSLEFSVSAPPGAFAVTVNGAETKVQSTQQAGKNVTLLLPEGSLQTGDEVLVFWQGGSTHIVAE